MANLMVLATSAPTEAELQIVCEHHCRDVLYLRGAVGSPQRLAGAVLAS
jgi:hypothetical protein